MTLFLFSHIRVYSLTYSHTHAHTHFDNHNNKGAVRIDVCTSRTLAGYQRTTHISRCVFRLQEREVRTSHSSVSLSSIYSQPTMVLKAIRDNPHSRASSLWRGLCGDLPHHDFNLDGSVLLRVRISCHRILCTSHYMC